MLKIILFEISMILSLGFYIFMQKHKNEKIKLRAILGLIVLAISYIGIFYEPITLISKIIFSIAFFLGAGACFSAADDAVVWLFPLDKNKDSENTNKSNRIQKLCVMLLGIICMTACVIAAITTAVTAFGFLFEVVGSFFH